MRTLLGTVAGLGGGLITSLICAAICVALRHYLGFSIFTLMVWFVIPAGATMVGFAASSGYYLSARLFDARANALMALGMVGIAGLTQFLIYFGTYATILLPDGRKIMDLIDFWTFVKVSLGHQRYTVGHAGGPGVDTGRIGYAIAGLQFLGFLAGGAFTFMMLKRQSFCDGCGRYFRRRLGLSTQGSAEYIDAVRAKAPLTTDYFGALQQAEGSGFKLNVSLAQCPACFGELVSEEVQVLLKKQWKPVPELSRKVPSPEPVFALFQSLPNANTATFGRFRS